MDQGGYIKKMKISREKLEMFSLAINVEKEEDGFIEEINKLTVSDFNKISFDVGFIQKAMDNISEITFQKDKFSFKFKNDGLQIRFSNEDRVVPIDVEEGYGEKEEVESLFNVDLISKLNNDFNFYLGMMFSKINEKTYKKIITGKVNIEISEPTIQQSCFNNEKISMLNTKEKGKKYSAYGVRIKCIFDDNEIKYNIIENGDENTTSIWYTMESFQDKKIIDLNNEIDYMLMKINDLISSMEI